MQKTPVVLFHRFLSLCSCQIAARFMRLTKTDMDDLFYNSPTFVPGSSWTPRSHVDVDTKIIAEHMTEDERKDKGSGGLPEDAHVENVSP